MSSNLKNIVSLSVLSFLFAFCSAQTTDTLILQDIQWNDASHASQKELTIPSGGSLLQGFIYKANGPEKHPTLLLLHGYPGNERNLDLAQVVRARGWNVIYFDYRGSWGSQGQFSFTNCVEDVRNVVSFCKKYSDSLQIDVSNIVLFGHSMGGWICLKALAEIPEIKKGFALSTWDIGGTFADSYTLDDVVAKAKKRVGDYFVLNTPIKERFAPILNNRAYYDLANDAKALSHKQIIMLDEHHFNKRIADAI